MSLILRLVFVFFNWVLTCVCHQRISQIFLKYNFRRKAIDYKIKRTRRDKHLPQVPQTRPLCFELF